ncbi:MAG: hypothetical protein PHG16_05295 [Lachnospiraceae bacterium]|nr:hypothetical protein [Lachnospiraceae bacterium]
MRVSNIRRRLWRGAAVLLAGCLAFADPLVCLAQISGPDAFTNATWESVHEENLQTPMGVLQSVCATDNYIICIENTSDFSNDPDTVSAYYKNKTDAAGNPVEQFSLAKRTADTDWEHGNGMAYNPNTHEIYVALYSNKTDETRGCLYVMNPDTLELVRTIKISDDYNILGIDYKSDTDQYVIQTNAEGGYSFKILDSNFQIVDDLGQYAGTAKGDNFQDLIISGDYIINFPLTLSYGIGNYLNVYSMSQRVLMQDLPLALTADGPAKEEPEGLCEINPGEFVLADNLEYADGRRIFRLYRTTVPYYFTVQVTGENGAVQMDSSQILRGESCTLNLAPNQGYGVSKILVDGTAQSVTADMTSYTLDNVQANHTVTVTFAPLAVPTEKPKQQKANAKTVNDVRVQSSVNEEVANPNAVKKSGFWNQKTILLTVLLGVVIAIMAGFYLYLLHVRRERARRRALARMRRRQAMWEQQITKTKLS